MQHNLSPEDIAGLNRDFTDIQALSECEGTDKIVLEKEKQLIFKIAAIGAYGGKPLKGISSLNQDFKDIDELKKE